MNITTEKNIIKIADNIYLLSAPDNGRFPYCHGFLFTGEQNLLIDAGADGELLSRIDKETGIDTLVISHSHPDHIRRWHILSHRKFIIPEETPDSVFDIELLGERFTGSKETGLKWAEKVAKPLGLKALRKPDGRYSDGDIFDLGKLRIEAIHAPGHLNDHYCFFEHVSGTLISTDIDFTSFGPWYGNPEGRIKPFKESIRKIMRIPYSRVCTSHKPPHEGNAEDRFNSFLGVFDRQKNEIFEFLESGKTLDQIAAGSIFYKHKFSGSEVFYSFEKHMSEENLSILVEEGRVKEENGLYIPADR